jgi:transmembrane sensor
MTHDIPWKLLEKHFANKSGKREFELVNKWKSEASENFIIYKQLEDYFLETGSLPVGFTPNTARALKKVSSKTDVLAKQITWPYTLLKIASVILFLLGGWWIIYQYSDKKKDFNFTQVNTSDTMRTMVTLPDNSHIWINSGSSLTYSKTFDKIREVFLKGEAYFEIARDTTRPFIIHAGKTTTRVLGTKFDIRSYSFEKQVLLTVTHGRVSFGSTERDSKLYLVGQKGIFDNQTGKLEKLTNNNPNFLAWKTREFYFDDETVEAIFKTLAEVYHFRFAFENSALKTRRLTASFTKRPLNEIIQTISVSANLSVSLQNKIYIIK